MACHFGFLGIGSNLFGLGSMMPMLVLGLMGFMAYKLFSTERLNRSDNRPVCSKVSNVVNDSSMEILNRKFASGEFTEEEYLRKKDLLRQ